MGCDIHGYVETLSYERWQLYTGRIYLPRDYRMFGLLAGVRTEGPPVVAPRDFPPDASFGLKAEFHIHVTESKCEYGECRITDLETADKWVKQGIARYLTDDARTVTDPDWHTPSWLTHEELITVLERYQQAFERWPDKEYLAVAAMMKPFSGSRFVFWFDN